MENEKYVVFKREEWENRRGHIPAEVSDAVVIRMQDMFAPSAFFAYAQSISTTIEIVEELGFPSEVFTKRMRATADYFMQAGEEAQKLQRKIPD